MAVLSYLSHDKLRIAGAVHINHGTPYGQRAMGLVSNFCYTRGIPLECHNVRGKNEMEWSVERRRIFNALPGPVVTAHHFDDIIEWWLMTTLAGKGRVTPYRTGNVIHPFRRTDKAEFVRWAMLKNVPFMDDPTNSDCSNTRSKVRAAMPQLLAIQPGLHTVVRRKMDTMNGEGEDEGQDGDFDDDDNNDNPETPDDDGVVDPEEPDDEPDDGSDPAER